MIIGNALAWRRIAAGLAAASLVTAGLVLGSAPAQADGVCGPNFNFVGSVPVDTEAPRMTLSEINVHYNPGQNKWCAVNRNITGNDADHMSVSIKRPNEDWAQGNSDSGPFKEYAGPVYRIWANSCIDVRGSTIIGNKSGSGGDRVCR